MNIVTYVVAILVVGTAARAGTAPPSAPDPPPRGEGTRVVLRYEGEPARRPLPEVLRTVLAESAGVRLALLECSPGGQLEVRATSPALPDSLADTVRRILRDESSYPVLPAGRKILAPMGLRITVAGVRSATAGADLDLNLGFNRGLGLLSEATGQGGGVLGQEASRELLAIFQGAFPEDAELERYRSRLRDPARAGASPSGNSR